MIIEVKDADDCQQEQTSGFGHYRDTAAFCAFSSQVKHFLQIIMLQLHPGLELRAVVYKTTLMRSFSSMV